LNFVRHVRNKNHVLRSRYRFILAKYKSIGGHI